MNSLKEEVNESDDITFMGYCLDHIPTEPKRLSFDLLVSTKTLKSNIRNASKANIQWVVDKVG